MPTYVLPTFNITVNIWRRGNAVTNPPDVSSPGNLSPGRLVGVNTEGDSYGNNTMGFMWLRLPAGTDVRDHAAVGGADTVEAPAGTGRYYTAAWVDDIGSGFANEHRFAHLLKLKPWGAPYAGGPTPPPPAPPPQSGFPVVVSNGATPSTGLAFQWTVPVPGTVTIFVMWANSNSFPESSFGASANGSVSNWTDGINTIYMGSMALQVGAGFGSTLVSLASGAAVPMVVVADFVPTPTLAYSNAGGISGAGSTPQINPGSNPFGIPLLAGYPFFSFINPPGPAGAQSPYATLATGTFNIALNTYQFYVQKLQAPSGFLPLAGMTPLGIWPHWGADYGFTA